MPDRHLEHLRNDEIRPEHVELLCRCGATECLWVISDPVGLIAGPAQLMCFTCIRKQTDPIVRDPKWAARDAYINCVGDKIDRIDETLNAGNDSKAARIWLDDVRFYNRSVQVYEDCCAELREETDLRSLFIEKYLTGIAAALVNDTTRFRWPISSDTRLWTAQLAAYRSEYSYVTLVDDGYHIVDSGFTGTISFTGECLIWQWICNNWVSSNGKFWTEHRKFAMGRHKHSDDQTVVAIKAGNGNKIRTYTAPYSSSPIICASIEHLEQLAVVDVEFTAAFGKPMYSRVCIVGGLHSEIGDHYFALNRDSGMLEVYNADFLLIHREAAPRFIDVSESGKLLVQRSNELITYAFA